MTESSLSNYLSPRMPLVPTLQALAGARTNQVIITTMGALREWTQFPPHPLDFHYIPSSMGQGPMLGLGLALAQLQREFIVITGDGSLLMNLGCLVTIVASKAKNLTVIVSDNGVYEVTGGQKTVGGLAKVDFGGFALAAGFETVATFDDLADWQAGVADVLAYPGPRFITWRLEPVREDYRMEMPGPIDQRLAKFRAAIGAEKVVGR